MTQHMHAGQPANYPDAVTGGTSWVAMLVQ